MDFKRIQQADNKYIPEIIALYNLAFPKEERRSDTDFLDIIENENLFHCNAVLMNDALVGFFNYWNFDTFIYVEHFAVEPPMRGNKLGEKIIKLGLSQTELPIVIEVEKVGQSEWASRRIEFYQRMGFQIIQKEYKQPPYRKGEDYLPLHIMSYKSDFTTNNFEDVKATIYRHVYNVQ